MPFVKLDVNLLNSSLWLDRPARELFITALLLAVPDAVDEPLEALQPDSLAPLGFIVPPGRYGMVHASPLGVIRQAGLEMVEGRDALRRLSDPDPDSRTPDFDGRRVVRVPGGLIVLNYAKYRERDYTASERQRRFRERMRRNSSESVGMGVTKRDVTDSNGVTSRQITHAEAEAEADKSKNLSPAIPHRKIINVRPPPPPAAPQWGEIKVHYPSRTGSQDWRRALIAAQARIREGDSWDDMLAGVKRYAAFCRATGKAGTEYVMQAARFFGPSRGYAEPWQVPGPNGQARPPVDPEAVRRAQEDAERRKQASIEAARRQFSGQSAAAASDPPALLPLPDLSIGR